MIQRLHNLDNGVFSELFVDGEHFCMYVENAATLIPAGAYKLVPHDGGKKNVVAFVNPALGVYHHEADVPLGTHGRTECLIHIANFPSELEGCGAPGERVYDFPEKGWGVTDSGKAMDALRVLWGDRHGLTAEIVDKP